MRRTVTGSIIDALGGAFLPPPADSLERSIPQQRTTRESFSHNLIGQREGGGGGGGVPPLDTNQRIPLHLKGIQSQCSIIQREDESLPRLSSNSQPFARGLVTNESQFEESCYQETLPCAFSSSQWRVKKSISVTSFGKLPSSNLLASIPSGCLMRPQKFHKFSRSQASLDVDELYASTNKWQQQGKVQQEQLYFTNQAISSENVLLPQKTSRRSSSNHEGPSPNAAAVTVQSEAKVHLEHLRDVKTKRGRINNEQLFSNAMLETFLKDTPQNNPGTAAVAAAATAAASGGGGVFKRSSRQIDSSPPVRVSVFLKGKNTLQQQSPSLTERFTVDSSEHPPFNQGQAATTATAYDLSKRVLQASSHRRLNEEQLKLDVKRPIQPRRQSKKNGQSKARQGSLSLGSAPAPPAQTLESLISLVEQILPSVKHDLLFLITQSAARVNLISELYGQTVEQFVDEIMRFLKFVVSTILLELGVRQPQAGGSGGVIVVSSQMKFQALPIVLLEYILRLLFTSLNYHREGQSIEIFVSNMNRLSAVHLRPQSIFQEICSTRGLEWLTLNVLHELALETPLNVQEFMKVHRSMIEPMAIQLMSNCENFEGITAYMKANEQIMITSGDYFLVKKAVIQTFKKRHEVVTAGDSTADCTFSKYVTPMNRMLEIIESTRQVLGKRGNPLLGDQDIISSISTILSLEKGFMRVWKQAQTQQGSGGKGIEKFVVDIAAAVFATREKRRAAARKISARLQTTDKYFWQSISYAFLKTLLVHAEAEHALLIDVQISLYALAMETEKSLRNIFTLSLDVETVVKQVFEWIEDHYKKQAVGGGGSNNISKSQELVSVYDMRFLQFFLYAIQAIGSYSANDTEYALRCYKISQETAHFQLDALANVLVPAMSLETKDGKDRAQHFIALLKAVLPNIWVKNLKNQAKSTFYLHLISMFAS